MIPQIPGWLNFIVLCLIYFIPLSLFFKIFGIGWSVTEILLRICLVEFWAGAYLSKYRETRGGGLSFNHMTGLGWLIAGIIFLAMILFIVFA